MANFPMPAYGEAELMGRVKGGFGKKGRSMRRNRGPRKWKGHNMWTGVSDSTLCVTSGQSCNAGYAGSISYNTGTSGGVQWAIIVEPTMLTRDNVAAQFRVHAPQRAQAAAMKGEIHVFPSLPGGGDPGNSDFWQGVLAYAWVKEQFDPASGSSNGLPDPIQYTFATAGQLDARRRDNVMMSGQVPWAFNVTADSLGVTRAAGAQFVAKLPYPRSPRVVCNTGAEFLGLVVQAIDLTEDEPVSLRLLYPSLKVQWRHD